MDFGFLGKYDYVVVNYTGDLPWMSTILMFIE